MAIRFKKQSLFITTPQWVIKLPLKYKKYIKVKHELQQNNTAQRHEFWQKHVTPATSCLWGLKSPRGEVIGENTASKVEDLIRKQCQLLANFPTVPATKIIQLETWGQHIALGPDQPQFLSLCQRYLADIVLPISPQHGDFRLGNFILYNGSLGIIDWENYQEQSSFLFDVFGFYHGVIGRQYGFENWLERVLPLQGIEQSAMHSHTACLLAPLNLKYEDAAVCYLLDIIKQRILKAKSAVFKRNNHSHFATPLVKRISEFLGKRERFK